MFLPHQRSDHRPAAAASKSRGLACADRLLSRSAFESVPPRSEAAFTRSDAHDAAVPMAGEYPSTGKHDPQLCPDRRRGGAGGGPASDCAVQNGAGDRSGPSYLTLRGICGKSEGRAAIMTTPYAPPESITCAAHQLTNTKVPGKPWSLESFFRVIGFYKRRIVLPINSALVRPSTDVDQERIGVQPKALIYERFMTGEEATRQHVRPAFSVVDNLVHPLFAAPSKQMLVEFDEVRMIQTLFELAL